jgi:predicted unusual protein kinase regulating ubiquinone biosynthesis (AarF/ABC1/UbiB family)
MARRRPAPLQFPPVASKLPDSRLGRLGKIMSLSGKVGGNLLARTASKLAGQDGGWAERRAAKQLVATLGQMKGLAQKMGQALSMDIDHLPSDVREIISALQSKSEPMDYPAIARVVEAELGKSPEQVFETFAREPLAAASLGQVHRATLRDGRAVAVKVQYPGAASAMAAAQEHRRAAAHRRRRGAHGGCAHQGARVLRGDLGAAHV